MSDIVYTPAPTVRRFMLSPAYGRWIMGPVGSGKTTGCIYELFRRSSQQAIGRDGYKRTRWAVVRSSFEDLRRTVLKDVMQLFGAIAEYRASEKTIYIKQQQVLSEWLLIPLDNEEDQKRLLSTQLTGAWINEFGETNPLLTDALIARIGRYPSKAMGGPTWQGIIGDSNFPSEDSPWYERLELKLPEDWAVFKQPGGLDPRAENRENLPDRYYERLVETNTPEWAERFVHAQYGKSLSGQAVFRGSFDPNYHVSNKPLTPVPGYPLLYSQDFGRTPTCLIGQRDHRGRLLVFAEATSQDMGLRQFLREKARPLLDSERFARFFVIGMGDPAGRQKTQVNEETPFDVMRQEGFSIHPTPTNEIEPRLGAVEKLLLERRGDGPALLIDGANCPQLVMALKNGYRYKKKKDGELEDKPEKNHPWSDLADALQYMALGMNTGLVGRVMSRQVLRKKPAPNAAAWT